MDGPDREDSLVDRSAPCDIRILLVEDNDVNSRLTTRMLARLGYKVDAVLNGREAIHALQSQAYAIVLMDLHMPEMDGLAATRWILSHPSEVQMVPTIIALTANTLPEDRKRCEESGMVDFIPKPIGFEALSIVLEKWSRRVA
jgi:CheY-like chemotaxis protein